MRTPMRLGGACCIKTRPPIPAGPQAGLKAPHTCTSWSAYAAMLGSSFEVITMIHSGVPLNHCSLPFGLFNSTPSCLHPGGGGGGQSRALSRTAPPQRRGPDPHNAPGGAPRLEPALPPGATPHAPSGLRDTQSRAPSHRGGEGHGPYPHPPPCASTAAVPNVNAKRRVNAHRVPRQARAFARRAPGVRAARRRPPQ